MLSLNLAEANMTEQRGDLNSVSEGPEHDSDYLLGLTITGLPWSLRFVVGK